MQPLFHQLRLPVLPYLSIHPFQLLLTGHPIPAFDPRLILLQQPFGYPVLQYQCRYLPMPRKSRSFGIIYPYDVQNDIPIVLILLVRMFFPAGCRNMQLDGARPICISYLYPGVQEVGPLVYIGLSGGQYL